MSWRNNQVSKYQAQLNQISSVKDKLDFLVFIYNNTMIQRGEELLDNFIQQSILDLVGVESPIFYEISRQEVELIL